MISKQKRTSGSITIQLDLKCEYINMWPPVIATFDEFSNA